MKIISSIRCCPLIGHDVRMPAHLRSGQVSCCLKRPTGSMLRLDWPGYRLRNEWFAAPSVAFSPNVVLVIASPEDGVITKAFAGRHVDSFDAEGILANQCGKLD